MGMKKAVKIILPVIVLTFMGAGGIVRGDDDMGTMAASGTSTAKLCLPPAWSLKLDASKRFETVLGGEAVLDWETGLVWEKSPDSTTKDWSDAIYYAYNKTVGGRDGWRLPTVEELKSLVDRTQSNPALPSCHPFTNVQSNIYWSSTTVNHSAANYAWVVHFNDGNVLNYYTHKDNNHYVWCVRGGHGHDAPYAP